MKPIASNSRIQPLGPHPEEAALFARPSRRMTAGTISPVAVLRDARILRQALRSALLRTRLMEDSRYDSYHGNADLIRKRKVAHVVSVEGIVLPAPDLGADQAFGDIEVDWHYRQLLQRNPLRLLQQSGPLAGVSRERSLVHQPVVFWIGESGKILLLGGGLQQKQIALGVIVVHDPAFTSHLEIADTHIGEVDLELGVEEFDADID